MKVLQNKPTIINLRGHIQNEVIKFRKNPNFIRQSIQELRPSKTHQQRSFFTPPITLDDEMKNDFKWLLNFNVKDILTEDIDDGPSGWNKIESHEVDKKESSCTKPKGDSDSRNLSEDTKSGDTVTVCPVMETVIEQCLQEKSLSIKSIYKWIRERYPCLKQTDKEWKNEVRMTLFGSPLFRIKKSPRGKCGVWYLDKSTCNDQNLSTPKQQSDMENLQKGNFLNKTSPLVCSPAKEYFNIYGAINESSKGMIPIYAENWLDTGFEAKDYIKVVKLEEPMESFEIEIPLASELLESEKYTSIEIPFINDDTGSIFI